MSLLICYSVARIYEHWQVVLEHWQLGSEHWQLGSEHWQSYLKLATLNEKCKCYLKLSTIYYDKNFHYNNFMIISIIKTKIINSL